MSNDSFKEDYVYNTWPTNVVFALRPTSIHLDWFQKILFVEGYWTIFNGQSLGLWARKKKKSSPQWFTSGTGEAMTASVPVLSSLDKNSRVFKLHINYAEQWNSSQQAVEYVPKTCLNINVLSW